MSKTLNSNSNEIDTKSESRITIERAIIQDTKYGLHKHILVILNTESTRFSNGQTVRILDAGCGKGELMAYIHKNLSLLQPDTTIEIYGFDVGDRGLQVDGFMNQTIENLSFQFPKVDWHTRIAVIPDKHTWPYPNNFFDVILSTQVLEHVKDSHLFFSEIYRTLKKEGYSVNVFPLKDVIFDLHLNSPLVHKILNYDLLIDYIKLVNKLGLGTFKVQKKSGISLDEYARLGADYVYYGLNYLKYNEVLTLAKEHDLCASFRYTQDLYIEKLRSILKMTPRFKYSKNRSGIIDFLLTFVFKYISSSTLYMEKLEIPNLNKKEE